MKTLKECPVFLAKRGNLSHISSMFRVKIPPVQMKGLETYE